jgi:hypothetical protein
MQEDTYYSQYLERRYSTVGKPQQPLDIAQYSKELAAEVIKAVGADKQLSVGPIEGVIRNAQVDDLARRAADSRTLAELFVRPQSWPRIVAAWRESPTLKKEVAELLADGMLEMKNDIPETATLTDLGKTVAERLLARNALWNQAHADFWDEEGKDPGRSRTKPVPPHA